MGLTSTKAFIRIKFVKNNPHVIWQSCEITRETGTEETIKTVAGFSYLQFKPRDQDPKNAIVTVCTYPIQQASDI